MKNVEIINNIERLHKIQAIEKQYERITGKKLFDGRVRITYAIRKNLMELVSKLKAYEEEVNRLVAEYRDTDAEQKEIGKLQEEENAKANEEGRVPINVSIDIIMHEGKSKDEYLDKMRELSEIEVEDVSIHKIPLDVLDGILLDSDELDLMMFMID
jgi:hypothetical protein